MPRVETPIKWLWLARGAEITLNLPTGSEAMVMLDDFEKTIQLGGRLPLKVPLIRMSVSSGRSPSVESLMADQLLRMLKRARVGPVMGNPHLYGILKSKGTQGGPSSGASGAPLVDSAEVGFVCLDPELLDTRGLIVLSPSRIEDLKLPYYIVEENLKLEPAEEAPRVSRYERKWVI